MGYDRKHLVRFLSDLLRLSGKMTVRRGRDPSYTSDTMRALYRVWKQTGCLSSSA